MGDHEHSPTAVALLDETVGQKQTGHPVQPLLRLIEDQQPARPGQNRRQRQTTPLPRGELLGQVPRHSGQVQIHQQVTNDVVGVGDAVTEAHQTQVLGDGQCGEEGLLSQVGGNGGALSARAGVGNVPKNPNLTSKRVQEPAACA